MRSFLTSRLPTGRRDCFGTSQSTTGGRSKKQNNSTSNPVDGTRRSVYFPALGFLAGPSDNFFAFTRPRVQELMADDLDPGSLLTICICHITALLYRETLQDETDEEVSCHRHLAGPVLPSGCCAKPASTKRCWVLLGLGPSVARGREAHVRWPVALGPAPHQKLKVGKPRSLVFLSQMATSSNTQLSGAFSV